MGTLRSMCRTFTGCNCSMRMPGWDTSRAICRVWIGTVQVSGRDSHSGIPTVSKRSPSGFGWAECGSTATNPLDLYYMPYTHSLDGAILWAIAAGFGYRVLRKADGWSAAVIVGAAVLSHWVLDLVVHRPDLPLYDNSLKVGFGLWNHPIAAFALEIAFLFGGMYLYWAATEAISRVG